MITVARRQSSELVRRYAQAAVLSASICSVCQPTFAQDRPRDARTLEEIVVTAQKREQDIKEIPFSISAISGEDLTRRDVSDALGLSFAVPGLNVWEQGAGRQDIMIRGIQSTRGGSSLTGVYLDEIPLSGAQDGFEPTYQDVLGADLQRIEVLKGPQGTLFGEGAAGGVVRYVTNDPDLNKIGGALSASLFDSQAGGMSGGVSGILNAPIVEDVFGIRAVATYKDEAGWIDNVGTGEEDFNDSKLFDARVKALWKPTDRLSLSALINVHRNEGGGSNVTNVQPYESSQFRQAVNPFAPTDFENDFEIFNLTATYDLGFATLLSSTSYYDAHGDASNTQVLGDRPASIEILISPLQQDTNIISQELRLSSAGDGPLNWVIGGNYKDNELVANFVNGLDLVLGDLTLINFLNLGGDRKTTSESWAGFADGSYMFGGRLEIGGGLRYFVDDRGLSNSLGDSQSDTFEKTSYRAFARYAATDKVNLYVTHSTGFRSGGFNSPANVPRGAPPSYGPEVVSMLEVGAKTIFMNGRLGFDIAAYETNYTDQQFDVGGESPVDGLLIQYTINAGEARIRGIEWLLTASPLERLTLSLGGNVFLDAEYTKTTNASPFEPGDRLRYISDYSLQVAANYGFDWAQGVPGNIDITYSRRDKQPSDGGTPIAGLLIGTGIAPPVDLLQARLAAEWDSFEISIFGRNLLDERDPLNQHPTGNTSQARPRTIGVEVRKSF